MDDSEEIVAAHALDDLAGVGAGGDGVCAEDEERLDRRIRCLAKQRRADAVHVDDARRGWAFAGVTERLRVPTRPVAHAVEETAATHADLADDGWQTGESARRL